MWFYVIQKSNYSVDYKTSLNVNKLLLKHFKTNIELQNQSNSFNALIVTPLFLFFTITTEVLLDIIPQYMMFKMT